MVSEGNKELIEDALSACSKFGLPHDATVAHLTARVDELEEEAIRAGAELAWVKQPHHNGILSDEDRRQIEAIVAEVKKK
jgi:uncharacterized FAD-dependent dehydrogenase